MKRRLAAVLIHFQVGWENLKIDGQTGLFINSGEVRPLTIARRSQDGHHLEPFDLVPIMAHIREHDIGVLVVDPFLETHEANENSNEEINRVTRMFRTIAKKTDCAVLLVHHTRKAPQDSSDGHAGNMDSARGASSLMGVARVAVTLYGMSPKDGKQYGLSDTERHLHVRLDDAKANMALMSRKPRWFRRVSIRLPNSKTSETLQCDEVGVLEPVTLAEGDTDEVFIKDAADALNGESMTVQALADKMRTEYPLYSDESDKGLRNRIMETFEQEITVGEWTIQYLLREDRSWGKHFVEIKEVKRR
jgi:hypothetical protein